MSQRLGQVYQATGESKRRSIDWSGLLGTDLISLSTWAITPAGMSTIGTGVTTTSTTIQVTDGLAGVTYKVENSLVTASAQKHKRHFLVTVEG
ncbi:MAG TPA: hypothetical protein VK467_10340 [Gemmatimonadales bacterium]|nr:hypothetical protein [Gemmatimonadales bacterium]